MALLIGAVLFSIAVGYWAEQRGRSGVGYFILSLIISPLLTAIVVLCLGVHKPDYVPPSAPVIKTTADEDAKWAELVRYDPDIGTAVAKLIPLGNTAVNRFRYVYTTVNNKAAIPAILADIEAAAEKGKLEQGFGPAIPEGKISAEGRVHGVDWKLYTNGVWVGRRGSESKAFHSYDDLKAHFQVPEMA